jgi:organic hydroperoxide reductase OsmC/OhrA
LPTPRRSRSLATPELEFGLGKEHHYQLEVVWTGNSGSGTSGYATYGREHEIRAPGKPPLSGSSDPAFRGDPMRWNPEELLVASLSACHMLWYLHLASKAGIVVQGYADEPIGVGESEPSGAGRFLRAVLRPTITVAAGADVARAAAIHHEIHEYCFIARSVNFPIAFEATYREV